MDYSVRVSSREAYVAPTRGAQGNALKTIIAMPYVLGGNGVEICSPGLRHTIMFGVNHVQQQPEIELITAADPHCKKGTRIDIRWPVSTKLQDAKAGILQIASDFTWLNPSLTLTLDWFGERLIDHQSTNPRLAEVETVQCGSRALVRPRQISASDLGLCVRRCRQQAAAHRP